MDIQDLTVFRAVANHGNISKAANELNFVQSSVTSKVKKLEAHYQTQLFYRHRYGVELTSAGRTLLNYTDKILHLFKEAERQIIYSDVPKGPISIGSMETTAAVRLPVPLATFSKKYPEVNLTLKTGPTDELNQLVLSYKLEGAFVASTEEYKDLHYETLLEEELILISNKEKPINDEELKNSNLLMFRQGCSYRRMLEKWLECERILPNQKMEFGSLEAILGCVHAGLGVSLLPKSVIENYQKHYTFSYFELPNDFGKIKTSFISRKDVTKTVASERFIEMVRNFYESKKC